VVKEQANLRAAYEWASSGEPPRDLSGAGRLKTGMHLEWHAAGIHVKDFVFRDIPDMR
jgi:hypothetical protein